jgi:aspartyl/asparaginyl beta-hydroxylase (cupin superfamily)
VAAPAGVGIWIGGTTTGSVTEKRAKKRQASDRPSQDELKRQRDTFLNTFFRKGWKRFYLKWYGDPLPSAQTHCPATVELLRSIPSVHGAMFALGLNGR